MKKTTEQFIKEAIEIHGGEYDYSLVKYIKSSIPVKIICPKHGVFEMRPNTHLNYNGCKKCKHMNKQSSRMTTEEFIEKSKQIHGDKYDYSKTKYTDCHCKIKIICPTHGKFELFNGNHLRGKGCKKCTDLKKLEKFIEKSKNKHSDKYDYSKVEYINSKTKVKIICKKHGIFEQTPNSHLNGCMCKKCRKKGN